jgi:hypothetical protein
LVILLGQHQYLCDVKGFVGWRLRVRIRRRAAAAAISSSSSYVKEKVPAFGVPDVDIEKPREVVLLPPKAAPGTTWVPQIRSVHSTPIHIAPLEPVEKKSSRHSKKQWAKTGSVHISIPEYSQLPNYQDGKVPLIALPPVPSEEDEKKSLTRVPTPPTPPVSHKKKPSSLNAKAASIVPKSPSRTSSFPMNPSIAPSKGEKRFPRLMTVIQTFEPSLEDELLVKLGETLRLIEVNEFHSSSRTVLIWMYDYRSTRMSGVLCNMSARLMPLKALSLVSVSANDRKSSLVEDKFVANIHKSQCFTTV